MRLMPALIGFAFAITPEGLAFAQLDTPSLDKIIDSVNRTYMVDKLDRAKTIRLEEELRIEYPSHDYGPNFHDLTTQKRHYILDIKNERASSEYLTTMGTNNYHGRSLIDQGKSLFIDYNSDTYEPQDDVEFMTELGGTFRSSDMLLAYHLVKNASDAIYVGTELWLGRDYHKVKLEFPSSPNLNIFVEEGSGRIGKMYRVMPSDVRISYTYDNHVVRNGLTFASDQSVFAGRDPLFFSFNRNVVLNNRADRRAFEVEDDIVQEATRVSQEEMTVDKIANGTHYVGQGEAYSVFVKSPTGLTILGTAAGLAERIEAYRAQSGDLSQIQYAMVADHHDTAMAGIEDAVAAGATLLITADSEAKIKTRFEDADTEPKIEVVSEKRAVGNVNFLNLTTPHATEVLVAYDTDNTFLYQLLHYASLYEDKANYAKHSAVILHREIKPYGVKPKFLLSAASRKPEAWNDFVAAVENYDPAPCFRNRPICR